VLWGLVVVLGLAPVAPAQAPDGACRVVVDHADGTPGEFPPGWEPRDDAARATYRIAVEDRLRFVRATAEGTGSQMGREFPWSADSHPILNWQWRPQVFPPGSDERASATNDSALAVYAVFGRMQMTARAVKYVWSRVVPAGTTLSTSRAARVIVLRSGPPADAGWVTETVDARRDYERLYGEAPGRARGVAVLTDADQTKSRAVGDYGAFRICAAPPR
jgi:hypothetical protein